MTTTAVVLVVPFPFVDTKFDFVDKDRAWSLFLTNRVFWWRDSVIFFGASCNSKPFLASVVSSPRPHKMPYFRSNSRRNFVCKIKKCNCHMRSFNNYMDAILHFFDNLPLRGHFLLGRSAIDNLFSKKIPCLQKTLVNGWTSEQHMLFQPW